jgi:hypothetical protein
MINETSDSLNPSLCSGLLKDFLGQKVVQLVRYSWWPKEDVSLECEICDELAFSLTAGPLAVTFETGNVLGVASAPSLNSVILWLDHIKDVPLSKNLDLFPINCDDKVYSKYFWKECLGLTLINISILKRQTMNAIQEDLPSEVGLSFIFENNIKFIASHGLHDESDDFSVLHSSQIMSSIAKDLEEIKFL